MDVLVSFEPGEQWSLSDVVDMKTYLGNIFGREVDPVLKESPVDPFGRRHILRTRKVIRVA